MPNNFDKILATCRSRGIYCVPILQSLAQIKTLFAEGAWEGVVGNCDTFLYLGGNEASTYEYISKLLGKWTIDKRTSGESKGSSGSYSENYDVLGRELMLEYEIRLLPDDECILFVRGEKPIRDKKWFPWEHEEYANAKASGEFNPSILQVKAEQESSSCQFMGNKSYEYTQKQIDKNDNIKIYNVNAYEFMMMDLDKVMGQPHGVETNDRTIEEKSNNADIWIKPEMICSVMQMDATRRENQKREDILQNYDKLSLLDIYSSGVLSDLRKNTIRELIQKGTEEGEIKSIVSLELSEQEVQEKKIMDDYAWKIHGLE